MANSVADELRKAFDSVGLRVDLVPIGYRQPADLSDSLQQYSFWVPETYRFQGHNPGHRWRRVEDESPEDDTEVLVWTANGGEVARFDDQGFYSSDLRVTHWMPLPAPPSD